VPCARGRSLKTVREACAKSRVHRIRDAMRPLQLVVLQAATLPASMLPTLHPRRTCAGTQPCVSRLRGGQDGGAPHGSAPKRALDSTREHPSGGLEKRRRADPREDAQAGQQGRSWSAESKHERGERQEDHSIASMLDAFNASATASTLGGLSLRAAELSLRRASKKALVGGAPRKSIQCLMSCPACWELLTDATTLPCGHTFCAACAAHGTCNLPACMYPTLERGVCEDDVLASLAKLCFPGEQILRESDLRDLGNKRMKERDFQGAEQAYEQALELNNRSHFVLGNLALALLGKGDRAEAGELKAGAYARALEVAERTVRFVPEWPKGWYRLGQAHRAGGNATAAWASFSICAYLLSLNGTSPSQDEAIRGQDATDSLGPAGEAALRVLSSCNTSGEGGEQAALVEGMPWAAWRTLENAARALCAPCEGDADLEGAVMQQDFGCRLCSGAPSVPLTAVCGHTFCESCLQQCLDRSSSCPSCSSKIYLARSTTDASASSFLNSASQSASSPGEAQSPPKTHHFGVNAVVCALLERRFPDRQSDAVEIERERIMAVPFAPLGAGPDSGGEWIGIFVCTVAFPGVPCPVHVAEKQYKLMIRRAMVSGGMFGTCMPRDGEWAESGHRDFVDCGTLLRIRGTEACEDGRLYVDSDALETFRVLERRIQDGYDVARVERIGSKHRSCDPSMSQTSGTDDCAPSANRTASQVNTSISGMEELIELVKEWEEGKMFDQIMQDIGRVPAYSDMNALSWWYAAFCTLLMGTGTVKEFDDVILFLLVEGDPCVRLDMADRARRIMLSAWSGTEVTGSHADALSDMMNRTSELRQKLAGEADSESGESGPSENIN